MCRVICTARPVQAGALPDRPFDAGSIGFTKVRDPDPTYSGCYSFQYWALAKGHPYREKYPEKEKCIYFSPT